MTRPALEYVALVVDDPAVTVALFIDDLGLAPAALTVRGAEVPGVLVGASALAFFSAEDPFVGPLAKNGVHHIALASEAPKTAAAVAGLPVTDAASLGMNGRAQVELDAVATGGVRTRIIEPLGLGESSSAWVERIDHLGVASANNKTAKRIFIEQLGCDYESEQTDSEVETLAEHFSSDNHPSVFHTRPSRLVGGIRVTFISVGDCELEFLQDLTVDVEADAARHDTAGNTRGDRSAIARYIARRGAGLHHIALKTPDIPAALAHLSERGHRMIDAIGRPGSRRAQIGFAHPSALGGVLLHFVQREEV